MKNTVLLLVGLVMICGSVFGSESKPDSGKGEGGYPQDAQAVIRVYNLSDYCVTNYPNDNDNIWVITGKVRNISPAPLKAVTLTVGKIERDQSIIERKSETINNLTPDHEYRFDVMFIGDPGNHYKITKVDIEQ